MSFTNIQLTTTDLPALAAVEWQSPDSRYRKLLRLEWRLTACFLFLVAATVLWLSPSWRSPLSTGITAGAITLVLVLYWLSIEISWPWLGYALREHDIAYRSGWIFRHQKFCPIARIQNVTLGRGPLDRRYGVATLRLYTAGAMAPTSE